MGAQAYYCVLSAAGAVEWQQVTAWQGCANILMQIDPTGPACKDWLGNKACLATAPQPAGFASSCRTFTPHYTSLHPYNHPGQTTLGSAAATNEQAHGCRLYV